MSKRIRKRLFSLDELESSVNALVKIACEFSVDAALIGGLAMQFYGSDRMTADIDFVADAPIYNLVPEVPFVRVLSFGGAALSFRNELPVDWVVRDDGFRPLYEAALRHAEDSELGYRIVTPEYLAAMKLAAGRSKDEDDLLFLLGSKDVGLNRGKTREIVREYLGGQFAVEAFDSLCAEADWRAERDRTKK